MHFALMEKTICGGLNKATNEVEDALEIVCESHHLTSAQVWISHKNENHVVFSSLDTHDPTKQMFALSYCVNSDDAHLFSSLKDYHYSCDTRPLKIGQGLSGRTLQVVQEPLFYRNINHELSDDRGPSRLHPANNNNKFSYLNVCLRSTHTGDLVDYAFEFLWPERRNSLILLESLLLTLEQCLPSFTFSFGDKLCVVDDVDDNSTGSIISKCFQFFHGNKQLSKTTTLVKGLVATTSIQLPTTHLNGIKRKLDDYATNLNEVHGENRLWKRKSSRESQSESTEKSCASINSDEILTIKAEYLDDLITFHLPSPTLGLAALKKEIDKRFDLSGRYRLMCLHEEQCWKEIESDKHVRDSIDSMTLENRTHIRLWVWDRPLKIT